MRPVVVAYRPDWPTRAGTLADELHEVLGASARRIEHIGSTAIPNMAAKDIIDFQVSVVYLTAATEAFADPLAATGFARSPYEHDHVPAGTSDEPTRWAKRLWTRRDERSGDVNLHFRLVGSPNERLALLFRDWFRAHPAVVPAYSAFKLALADAIADTATYAEVKDPIVDLVIGLAEQWAESIGWKPAEGSAWQALPTDDLYRRLRLPTLPSCHFVYRDAQPGTPEWPLARTRRPNWPQVPYQLCPSR